MHFWYLIFCVNSLIIVSYSINNDETCAGEMCDKSTEDTTSIDDDKWKYSISNNVVNDDNATVDIQLSSENGDKSHKSSGVNNAATDKITLDVNNVATDKITLDVKSVSTDKSTSDINTISTDKSTSGVNNVATDKSTSNINSTSTEKNTSSIINVTSIENNETIIATNYSKVIKNMKYQIKEEEICTCDLSRGACDINCCCDKDCLHVNRDIFDNCSVTTNPNNEQQCLSTFLQTPLLCVVTDNLYSKHFYPDKKIIKDYSKVESLLKKKKEYSWSHPKAPPKEYPKLGEEYKIGSTVWIVRNRREVTPFQISGSQINGKCNNELTVRYLENTEDKCRNFISKVSVKTCEDVNSPFNVEKYSNLEFLISPHLINSSLDVNCNSHCIRIKKHICESDDLGDCIEGNNTKTMFDENLEKCLNMVERVHYVISHNGTEGITDVNLYFQLFNMELLSEKLLWLQQFVVTFQWHNQTNTFEPSGQNGYKTGKPIITGYQIPTMQNNDTTFNFSRNKYDWFTFFTTHHDFSCLPKKRNNLLFKYNLFVQCAFDVPEIETMDDCENFQKTVYQVLLGDKINISNLYVSRGGYPNLKNVDTWVPVLSKLPQNPNNDTCYGLITSISVEILYSLTGDYENPEESIFAATLTGIPFEYDITEQNAILLTSSVNFHDMSHPPLRIFAEPPTYEVKLPTDFFYPFFSTANRLNIFTFKLVIAILFFNL